MLAYLPSQHIRRCTLPFPTSERQPQPRHTSARTRGEARIRPRCILVSVHQTLHLSTFLSHTCLVLEFAHEAPGSIKVCASLAGDLESDPVTGTGMSVAPCLFGTVHFCPFDSRAWSVFNHLSFLKL